MCQSLVKKILKKIRLESFRIDLEKDEYGKEYKDYDEGLYLGQMEAYVEIYKYVSNFLEEEKEGPKIKWNEISENI